MSGHGHIKRPDPERFNLTRSGLLPFLLIGVGILALLVSMLGLVFNPLRLGFTWLWAYMFVFTLAAGTLFWVILHHIINANWTTVVRRLMENVSSMFWPWLVLLFLPLAWFLTDKQFYMLKWFHVDPADDVILQAKTWFLNEPFFWGRQVVYFLFFGGAAWLMRRWSVMQDDSGDVKLSLKLRKVGNAAMILFGLVISFSAIDWLMALNYHWFSTMFGVYIFAGTAGASMAFVILLANGLHRAGYLRQVFTVEHNHIMGKLLFAFTIFWAYISFSQYMLIYYANIPEETIWFAHRNAGSWGIIALILVFGHFFLPFILLLTQPAKRNPRRLCTAAGIILFMHLLDLYWIIMPEYQIRKAIKAGVKSDYYEGLLYFSPHWLDLSVLVGMLALLAGIFLWRKLPASNLFPLRDPRLYESVTLKN
ncbi:MAG: hypothetical protein ACFCUX_06975 [Candidatus Methylacidiphilales bacterium]